MSSIMFAKGMGIGMVVGSAIGMTVVMGKKRNSNQNKIGRTLKTVSDIVDNIGTAFSM